jgi:hypothetical protein
MVIRQQGSRVLLLPFVICGREKVRKSIGNFGVLVKLSDKHAIQKADEKSKNELKRRHSTQQHKKQHEVKQARLTAKKQKTTSQ